MAANKFGIDVDALTDLYAQARAKQGETLRRATEEATVRALQGRELTLKTIRDVLKVVTQAASAGTAQNTTGVNPDLLLTQAVEGMDAAVRQAVEASRRALSQFVEQGLSLQDKQLGKALDDIEKMGAALFDTIGKAAASAAQEGLRGPWGDSLAALQKHGSATGTAAADATRQLTERARQMSRDGAALNQRMARAFADHYATLASGVLIGMSNALGSAPPPAPAAKPRSRRRAAA